MKILSLSKGVLLSAMNKLFQRFAEKLAYFAGTSWAFILAVALLISWAMTGPLFDFSEQWQLIVNSFTTIVTFLMVFIIQNTQNRDFKALHLKLDELIRTGEGTHPGLIALQNLSDDELSVIEKGFERLRRRSGGSVRDVLAEIEDLAKAEK
jgi:low affinity Fe/Cu permease